MEVTTKLDKLYSLREEFSILGITGRTGSGCTDVAKSLSNPFENLDRIVAPRIKSESIEQRKYKIVYDFNSLNWKQYRVIKYKNILLLIMCQNMDIRKFRKHLLSFYRFSNFEYDNQKIENVHQELHEFFTANQKIIDFIKQFGNIRKIKTRNNLKLLADFYWNHFENFADNVDDILKKHGVAERTKLLHHTAINFRKSGQAYESDNEDFQYIYFIAEVINRIIKGTKILQRNSCHIVIDSLRNSLEINFFKERYSGFYLVAVKSDERRTRLLETYGKDQTKLINRLLELDETEYKCSDFSKGHFFSPDVQNCIQKADFHILNNHRDSVEEDFDSVQQQLLKLQGLIQQPGLITPSAVERCMQMAFTAKLSSGCISRQVGAVITDSDYSIKSIGWNDVPKTAVPCALRNIKEIGQEDPFGFSDFERGVGLTEKDFASKENLHNPDNAEIDKESKDFNEYLKASFSEEKLNTQDLGGINCPYCFKTAYNKFKGEINQVHTRSLHAEENAMMQISKYGGQPLKNGFLFTTASPCELCAKKAFQLGITNVFYIDPYPGISRSHILKQSKKNPNLKMFHGAIGRGYIKFYEPFLAQKDEISILSSHSLVTPQKIKVKQLKEMFSKNLEKTPQIKKQLDELFKDDNNAFDSIVTLIEEALISRGKNSN